MSKRTWILAALVALACAAPAHAGGLYSGNHYKTKMVDGGAQMRAATYGSGYAASKRVDGAARAGRATYGAGYFASKRYEPSVVMRGAKRQGPYDAETYNQLNANRGHFRPE